MSKARGSPLIPVGLNPVTYSPRLRSGAWRGFCISPFGVWVRKALRAEDAMMKLLQIVSVPFRGKRSETYIRAE